MEGNYPAHELVPEFPGIFVSYQSRTYRDKDNHSRPEPSNCVGLFDASIRIRPVSWLGKTQSNMNGSNEMIREAQTTIWVECRNEDVQASVPISM